VDQEEKEQEQEQKQEKEKEKEKEKRKGKEKKKENEEESEEEEEEESEKQPIQVSEESIEHDLVVQLATDYFCNELEEFMKKHNFIITDINNYAQNIKSIMEAEKEDEMWKVTLELFKKYAIEAKKRKYLKF
jgi:ATP-dependent 26S proteasome regulatory subunit